MAAPTLLQQREIEAKVLAAYVRAVSDELGESRAREILAEVMAGLAREAGCAAAERVGGQSLAHLRRAIEAWTADDALELQVLRADDQALEFNVTRCRYAEMYARLGLRDLGPILSCGRDAAMIAGFNPAIRFQRTQTLMEGAAYCDFRYALPSPPTDEDRADASR